MIALRTYFPILAKRLGKRPDQLNEWLRALVAAKALRLRPGRGPGSGVELNGDSVAMVLLALSASRLRKEAVARAKVLAKAKPLGHSPSRLYLLENLVGKPCPISGATNLRDAIAAGLEGHALRNHEPISLREIKISQNVLFAEILLARGSSEPELVSFSSAGNIGDESPIVTAVLGRDVLAEIAYDLRSLRQGAEE
jgi:hypothetical protein